jgi:hypothetical protein
MKRIVAVILAALLCISLAGCGAYFDALDDMGSAYQEQMDKILGGDKDDSTENKQDEQIANGFSPESSSDKNDEEESTAQLMDDGYINGTNAKSIETSLKNIDEYNWWDDHSLIQSQINKEWSVYCANNEYNTYTKSYDLSAYDTLEIQTAEFRTYDFDYEYLLFCASFFDTDLIDADQVKEWVRGYDKSQGTIEKTFGDAEFTLSYTEYDDGECYIELSVWACGDINSN